MPCAGNSTAAMPTAASRSWTAPRSANTPAVVLRSARPALRASSPSACVITAFSAIFVATPCSLDSATCINAPDPSITSDFWVGACSGVWAIGADVCRAVSGCARTAASTSIAGSAATGITVETAAGVATGVYDTLRCCRAVSGVACANGLSAPLVAISTGCGALPRSAACTPASAATDTAAPSATLGMRSAAA